ncbi:Dynamin-2A [Zea mays]|jgi:dynamin 1/3|nr:Dynamin-2A [Zea mays]PWZ26747.1 Dynamin-2A [Zea mays]
MSSSAAMVAIAELVQLSESMRLDASLPADDDPSNETASHRPSTILNAVALGNVSAGKSAVLNSLIGHPVLPTGENHATRTAGNPGVAESGAVVCW